MPFHLLSPSVATALAFAGLCALSLAMDRHHDQVTGHPTPCEPWRWAWRALGLVLLGVSLRVCVRHWGASIGGVAWWGLLSLAATGVVLTLSYGPRRLPLLAVIAGGAGLGALAV